MSSASRINVVSGRPWEFSGNFSVGGITYHVQTENMGPRNCIVLSRIYLKGEVVFTRKVEYSRNDSEVRIRELMENCHDTAIRSFSDSLRKKEKSRADYFSELQESLAGRDRKYAMETIERALEKFPTDPLLLSYYGLLVATFRKEPKEGVKICRNALAAMKESLPLGSHFLLPTFYLNLGRAYLAAGRKKEAISTFQEGLRNDPDNAEISAELKKMGKRRRPPVPFLERNHPVNKYIGKLISKVSK